MVTFLNEPKYSPHEVDRDFNERRKELIPKIEDFISSHSLFSNKAVNVTFLHTGVSSVVCILDDAQTKLILKIPLSNLNSKLEGVFLSAWEKVGVKVPHVIAEGEIGGRGYILMEYIDVEALNKKYTPEELIQNKTYRNLGVLLKQMHSVKTEGYSNIVNSQNKPEYSHIAEWIKGDTRMHEQFEYVKEHQLLDSLDSVFETISNSIGDSKETVYCHNDFHAGNIFATEPFTVFDPWPCFHHPFMDIARSIIIAPKAGLDEVTKQISEGYFGTEEHDKKLLNAFIMLNIIVKLPYMHKTNSSEEIKALQEYVERIKTGIVE